MPYVTCDACRAESMAPRELVGLLWDCPKCSRPIRVEDDSPGSGGRRAAHGTRGNDASDDVSDYPRRRRSSGKSLPTGFIVLASLAGAVGIGLGVAYTMGRGNSVIVPGEGIKWSRDNWTHQDLANHLREKGIPVHVKPTHNVFGGSSQPAAIFYENPIDADGDARGESVLVTLCADTAAAREAAGTSDKFYSWGRWMFQSQSGKYPARIREALR